MGANPITAALGGRPAAALARHLGLTEARLSRYRAGLVLPPVAVLRALAAAIGVPPVALLGAYRHLPRVERLMTDAARWGVDPVALLELVEVWTGASRAGRKKSGLS